MIGNMTLTAGIGFDETGRPAEVFLTGAKDGSGMAAILDGAPGNDSPAATARS